MLDELVKQVRSPRSVPLKMQHLGCNDERFLLPLQIEAFGIRKCAAHIVADHHS